MNLSKRLVASFSILLLTLGWYCHDSFNYLKINIQKQFANKSDVAKASAIKIAGDLALFYSENKSTQSLCLYMDNLKSTKKISDYVVRETFENNSEETMCRDLDRLFEPILESGQVKSFTFLGHEVVGMNVVADKKTSYQFSINSENDSKDHEVNREAFAGPILSSVGVYPTACILVLYFLALIKFLKPIRQKMSDFQNVFKRD